MVCKATHSGIIFRQKVLTFIPFAYHTSLTFSRSPHPESTLQKLWALAALPGVDPKAGGGLLGLKLPPPPPGLQLPPSLAGGLPGAPGLPGLPPGLPGLPPGLPGHPPGMPKLPGMPPAPGSLDSEALAQMRPWGWAMVQHSLLGSLLKKMTLNVDQR